jgi:SAM-dependent methyltransferase
VIEHVGDVPTYLREIDRVLAPGAHAAFATPNRYSLTAEPHVFVWGVGWLPRRWQKRYVKLCSGRSYDFVRLLSVREARRLFRRYTDIEPTVIVPQVPPEDLTHFPRIRKTIARVYNALAGSKLLAPVFHSIGPFFRIVGRKRTRGDARAHP